MKLFWHIENLKWQGQNKFVENLFISFLFRISWIHSKLFFESIDLYVLRMLNQPLNQIIKIFRDETFKKATHIYNCKFNETFVLFLRGATSPFYNIQISPPSLISSKENLKKNNIILWKMLVNFLKNLFASEPMNNQRITNAKRILMTVFLPLQRSQKIVFFIFLREL